MLSTSVYTAQQKKILGHNTSAVLCHGTVGKCLGPTMSKGLQKMAV